MSLGALRSFEVFWGILSGLEGFWTLRVRTSTQYALFWTLFYFYFIYFPLVFLRKPMETGLPGGGPPGTSGIRNAARSKSNLGR